MSWVSYLPYYRVCRVAVHSEVMKIYQFKFLDCRLYSPDLLWSGLCDSDSRLKSTSTTQNNANKFTRKLYSCQNDSFVLIDVRHAKS